MRKFWKILRSVGWALGSMANAEREFMLRQNLCPHCGGKLRSTADTGPR